MPLSEFLGVYLAFYPFYKGGRYALKVVFSACPPTMYALKRVDGINPLIFCGFQVFFGGKNAEFYKNGATMYEFTVFLAGFLPFYLHYAHSFRFTLFCGIMKIFYPRE